jgi:hypothetical protein
MRLFRVCVVLFVDRGLAKGWSPVQGVLPTVYRNWKSGQGPTKGFRAIIINNIHRIQIKFISFKTRNYYHVYESRYWHVFAIFNMWINNKGDGPVSNGAPSMGWRNSGLCSLGTTNVRNTQGRNFVTFHYCIQQENLGSDDGVTVGISGGLAFVYRPVFSRTHCFGNVICFDPQVKGWKIPTLFGPLERGSDWD